MATDSHTHPLRYETQDASPRGLFLFFVSISIFLILMGLLVAWLFGHFTRTETRGPVVSQPFENARSVPPPPLLQPAPAIDIQQYLQSQQQVLGSYGWVDRQQGVVRIPIDRAMDLLSQKGFPIRPQQDAAAAAKSGNAAGSAPAAAKSAAPGAAGSAPAGRGQP